MTTQHEKQDNEQNKLQELLDVVKEIEDGAKQKEAIDEDGAKRKKAIDEGINRKLKGKRAEALDSIHKLLSVFNFSQADLFPTKMQKEKNKSAPKKSSYAFVVGAIYEKDGQRWEYTGKKGRRPAWVTEAIEQGNIASLHVKT